MEKIKPALLLDTLRLIPIRVKTKAETAVHGERNQTTVTNLANKDGTSSKINNFPSIPTPIKINCLLLSVHKGISLAFGKHFKAVDLLFKNGGLNPSPAKASKFSDVSHP